MKYAGYVALVVGLLSLAGSVALVGWYYHQKSNVTVAYTWRIEYGAMPEGDVALLAWIKSQPGVETASVAREGKVLVVNYEAEAAQPLPDVLEKADALGYGERGSFFGDMKIK